MPLRHFDTLSYAPSEALIKATMVGVYIEETRPDILGDKYHVTTPELWKKREVLGSGSTRKEAWEDAYISHSGEVWNRIFDGAYVRDIEMEDPSCPPR